MISCRPNRLSRGLRCMSRASCDLVGEHPDRLGRPSICQQGVWELQLDDVSFFYQCAPGEALEPERRDIDLGLLIQQQLGEQQRRSGGLHEAVAAEAGRAPEAFQLWDRSEDRLVVGRHLVEAGPGGLHTGPGQSRSSARCLREHLLEEVPADVRDVAWRLFTVAHAYEHAGPLPMKVKRSVEID